MNGQWPYLLTTCVNLGRQLQVELGCPVLAIGRSSIQLQAPAPSSSALQVAAPANSQNKSAPRLKIPELSCFTVVFV
jgi:hypothetical protein